jgi:23S rRNA G2445 N2-methylase RlmL
VVAAELAAAHIGAYNVQPARAGVAFRGTQQTGYRAVLWLRAAVRVLVRLASAELQIPPGGRGGDAVYDLVRAQPWADIIPHDGTFGVDARVWDCEDLSSELLAATRAKDAVCDALRAAGRPKPPPPAPGSPGDVPLFLTCYRGKALLYRDLAGVSLHKRGYRSGGAIHRAALSEAVAAGILALAGWRGAPPGLHAPGSAAAALAAGGDGPPPVLVDPMCGSGTFLVEGAMMAADMAPGLFRAAWPFEAWPDHDAGAWQRCVAEARDAGEAGRQSAAAHALFFGADAHPGALALAQASARGAGVDRLLRLDCADVRRWAPPLPPGARVALCVTNPPWGGRLQGTGPPAEDEGAAEAAEAAAFAERDVSGLEVAPGDLPDTWFALGQFLKQKCGGAQAAVLCGNRDVAAKLFLPLNRRHPLTVGGVDCRLLHFTLLPPKPPRQAEAPDATQRAGAV